MSAGDTSDHSANAAKATRATATDAPTTDVSALAARARAVRRTESPETLEAAEALALAEQLKTHGLFGDATGVLTVTLARILPTDPLRTRLVQQVALCTYKDKNEPRAERFDRALAWLDALDLPTTTDQETLGIAASIWKRKWEVTAQIGNLRRSLAYYSRGAALGAAGDGGYTTINAAFVNDVTGAQFSNNADEGGNIEDGDGGVGGASAGQAFHDRAAELRRSLAEWLIAHLAGVQQARPLGPEDWWTVATLAEALIGTGRFEEAGHWLGRIRLSDVPAWKIESTVRQLGALLTVLPKDAAFAEQADALLRRHFPAAARAMVDGADERLGLSLSGGGFRAALFHLGVLARLAETDVLRRVEVVSCVSGGSIVGAYYFLAVRDLLQTKKDDQITPDDYVRVVRDMIDVMVRGIQKNLRVRSLAQIGPNLRVLFDPQYTRTEHIAELYDDHFYQHAPGVPTGTRVRMRDLSIQPLQSAGEPAFVTERDNWARHNKVPTLVLNATALNTGHCWQFTPRWMGESRAHLNSDAEAAYYLRRMTYDEAPDAHRDLPLSRAVAASSCVPGLFPPIRLVGLYEGILVALVDGAIHDNQGVASLLAEDCTACVVSDGAGHMPAVDRPALSAIGVGARSNTILQNRLRETQYREMAAMERALLLRRSSMHLKKDFSGQPISWIGCDTPPVHAQPPASTDRTEYGVSRTLQSLLATMRTDLDAFSDIEASALMLDGYRLAEQYARIGAGPATPPAAPPAAPPASPSAAREPWRFFDADRLLSGEDQPARTERMLRVGGKVAGKLLYLLPRLGRGAQRATWAVLVSPVVLVAIICLIRLAFGTWRPAIWVAAAIGLALILTMACFSLLLVSSYLLQLLRRPDLGRQERPSLFQLAIDVALLLFGFVPAWLYLRFANPLYLRLGRIETPAAQK